MSESASLACPAISAWPRVLASIVMTSLLSIATTASAADPHSYAEPDRVKVTAIDLDLDVDFESRTLSGSAELKLEWRDPDATELALDTRDLTIRKIETRDAANNWREVEHAVAPRDAILGQKLTITTGDAQPTAVRVHYRTAPTASGLQWLTPAQTLGKQAPFMFSQSQAIHARSWVPLQDTPAVRFAYTARLRVPKGLLALMSAENPQALNEDGRYRFRMAQPIPSYLMAIAVGRLEFKAISERAGVYAEPERLEAAVAEFADTEKMIEATEKLYGDYRWGRYDLLILPPSFPYGGMENPRLSFITPTVIAGDKSLVALIAHELAHSWSGNLVTNNSWDSFWLNEGFTSYVENRIVESLYGAERANMEFVLDTRGLLRDFRELPVDDNLQRLNQRLAGLDPDDVYTQAAYTKGSWFLKFLERRVGREVLDDFLRSYFDHFAFQSIDTATFRRYLDSELLAKHEGKVEAAQVEAWIEESGIPDFAPAYEAEAFAKIDAARQEFLGGEREASALPGKDWSTQEWLYFLNALPEKMNADKLSALDEAFSLTGTRNSEIAFTWFQIGIRNGSAPIKPALEKFLVEIGRRKFVVPLYRALAAREDDREWAQRVFARARAGYHPITTSSVEEVFRAAGGS
jgi:leukotriene A-4 hydrolase/aminopeptidase